MENKFFTYYQFYNTMLLIILTIVSLLGLIYLYNKKEAFNKIYPSIILLLLFFISFFRFLENTMPYENISYQLINISYILFIMYIITFYFYILNQYVPFKYFIYCFIISSIALMVITGMNKEFIIIYYHFNTIKFSIMYKSIMVLLTVISYFIIVFIYSSSKKILDYYSNLFLSIIILLIYSIPITIYSYSILKKIYYTGIYELYFHIFFSVVLFVVLHYMTPIGISFLTIDKLGSIIPCFIFVLDEENNIIYKNNNRFKDIAKISDISDLFDKKLEYLKDKYGEEYIKHGETYFKYTNREIKHNDEVVGFIITISDINNIIGNLTYLEDKINKTKNITKQLEERSKVVYDIEKEKEINNLLDKIVFNKKKEINNLMDMLQNLKINIEKDEFEDLLNDTLKYNEDLLNNIRYIINEFK